MKAIVFEASRSLNPSISLRRAWLRLNLSLRNWSRATAAKHERTLIAIAVISLIISFVATIADHGVMAVGAAIVALAAMSPEFTAMSYDKEEEGGELC